MAKAWLATQAKDSLVCKQYGKLLRTAPQDDLFYQRLRSSSDVKMALMVRASRNLPIKLLAGEYERILRRRLAVVGGSPNDSALAEMVRKFRCCIAPDSSPADHGLLSQVTCACMVQIRKSCRSDFVKLGLLRPFLSQHIL